MTRRWFRSTTREPVAAQDTSLFDQPLPDPTVPRQTPVSAGHPRTAIDASYLVAVKAGTQRARVLDLAYCQGARGITAAEAAEYVGRSRNQVAARMLELRRQGWLSYEPGGSDGELRKRTTEGNNAGLVHVLTERGRVEWAARSTSKDHQNG